MIIVSHTAHTAHTHRFQSHGHVCVTYMFSNAQTHTHRRVLLLSHRRCIWCAYDLLLMFEMIEMTHRKSSINNTLSHTIYFILWRKHSTVFFIFDFERIKSHEKKFQKHCIVLNLAYIGRVHKNRIKVASCTLCEQNATI